MRLVSEEVVAPEFPDEVAWANCEPLKLADCIERGPMLVEFWDFARVNSLRTLPYMEQWHSRYAPLGATIVGVHTPGFSCSADPDTVPAALDRLGVRRPVLIDSHYRVWHDYGNKGWPGRYLWGPEGKMRYYHYGEGDYQECELALQDALREYGYEDELPPLLAPLRPEDAPDAAMPAQTADIALPGDSERVRLDGPWSEGRDWLEAGAAGATLTAGCDAGGAWAVLSGDGVPFAGCHQLEIAGGQVTVAAGGAGLRVHALQFTPRT